jgi:competence protein ComEC
VLKIFGAGGSALLTGDISEKIEQALVASGKSLKTDVLLAPHHGSRHSSSSAFLHAVSPHTVIFSVGANNPYGHPHSTVLARSTAVGAGLYRTDTDGAVIVEVGPSDVRVQRWGPERKRYWQNTVASYGRSD